MEDHFVCFYETHAYAYPLIFLVSVVYSVIKNNFKEL